MDLSSISPEDAARALCLWVNSPGNPAGQLEDLGAVARWGRAHDVPVFSDECYVEFTWAGPGRTILEHGAEGVVAVHSLSKRSNLAGLRAGFFAGDAELVGYLSQSCASTPVSWSPDPCSTPARWRSATTRTSNASERPTSVGSSAFAEVLSESRDRRRGAGRLFLPLGGGPRATRSGPTFGPEPRMGLDAVARRSRGSPRRPGDTYGPAGAGHVRVALVQPDERLELVARRLRGPSFQAEGPGSLSVMDDLSNAVAELWKRRKTLSPGDRRGTRGGQRGHRPLGPGRGARGRDRPASDEVVVHEWLRQAILLLFILSEVRPLEHGPFEYTDKLPLKHGFARPGVRAVPGASARAGPSWVAGSC